MDRFSLFLFTHNQSIEFPELNLRPVALVVDVVRDPREEGEAREHQPTEDRLEGLGVGGVGRVSADVRTCVRVSFINRMSAERFQ